MRLSAWRAAAPSRDAAGPKVAAIVDPVLVTFGAEPDPHCWVVWGDDPANRYTILVPIGAGLLTVHVRVLVAGEGPRASAKVVRWSKLQVGELVAETQAPHRIVNFQVEQAVIQAADEAAEAVARFALVVFAAIDGRPWPPFDPGSPPHSGLAADKPGRGVGG